MQNFWFKHANSWVIVNALSLLVLSLVMFRLQAPVTFFRYDGTFILSVVKNQADWMPGIGVFTMDFLKGLGGIWFPMDTRMILGFAIGRLGGVGDWLPALSATWFAAELAIATMLTCRTLELETPVGVTAAWLAVLGALPYFVPAPALERLWGNPHLLSFIAYTTIALMLFLSIGRGSTAQGVRRALGIMLILSYLVMINPLSAALVLPVFGFFALVGLTMAGSRHEFRQKFASGTVIAAVLAGVFGIWLVGLFAYAKTTFFWSEMYPSSVSWRSVSLLVEDSRRPLGALFLIAAVLGGILTMIRASTRRLRRFSIGYLAFVGILWTLVVVLVATGGQWQGPPISYLDFMIYPLHALFAARFLYYCLERVPRIMTSLPSSVMLVAALLPWVALLVWAPPYQRPLLKNEIPFGWPPQRTAIVDFLEREIALRPDEPFRGRVVNIAGSRFAPEYVRSPFINQHNYDGMIAYYLGNDHREYGFWVYNIPTLDNTNHITSPFSHLLIARLLNPHGSIFTRAHETASVFEPKILAQLGVRYVLTEEQLSGRKPVLELEVVPGRKQYLYELDKPNLAGRSPTTVTVVKTADKAIARLSSPDIDFEKEAVLLEQLPEGPLVSVYRSRLGVERGALSLSAEASGRALLVLPLEFSRCLEFTWSTSAEEPLAVRANLDQTGILFSGRIEGRISLRHGPFANPTCRLRDLQDAKAVALGVAQ
jgi:hypothetical protein